MQTQESTEDGNVEISRAQELSMQVNSVTDKEIDKAVQDIKKIEQQRNDLNAKANAIRANLKKKGISPAAFKAFCSRAGMDEDKRLEMDITMSRLNRAVGVDYQSDMFDEGNKH